MSVHGFDEQTQGKLAQVTRNQAVQATRDHALASAAAAAESLASIVINDDETASSVLSLLRQVKDGEKALGEARRRILEPYERAKREVQDVFFPVERALHQAEVAGKAALTRYRDEQDRRAREARAKEMEEQRRRDEEARKQAEGMALPAPPPVVMSPFYMPPAPIATADAQMGRTSTLHCELADVHECDPTWVKLDAALAKAVFRREMRDEAEALRNGVAGKKVRFNGVDFWYEFGVAIREAGRASRTV